jgi:hypothetical protein
MAGYIPYHGKKRERLKRQEDALRRLIRRGASRDKLLKAALEVRDCRIRVLRVKQATNPERNQEERAAFIKVERDIEALQAVTADEVLAEFLTADE